MQNMVSLTSERVKDFVQKNGCVSLNSLEVTLNTSFNLIFLAIDNLVEKQAIILRKGKLDYFICPKGGELLKS